MSMQQPNVIGIRNENAPYWRPFLRQRFDSTDLRAGSRSGRVSNCASIC